METRYIVTYIDRNNGDIEAAHALVPAASKEGAATLFAETRSWAQVVDVSEIQELRGVIDALELQSDQEITEGLLAAVTHPDDRRALALVAEETGSTSIVLALRTLTGTAV